MKRLYIAIAFAAALALTIFAAACSSRGAASKPIVTVSLQPQKFMLERIAGDDYDIRCLLANGGNPESYDPSLTNLMNTENSIAFLRMGNIGFEEALVDKIHESNPSLPIFDTSVGIEPLKGTHGDHPDPHTWSSVKNARIIARNMRDAMTRVDPANADRFARNYTSFIAELDSLDSLFASRLASAKSAAFLVWHPSLSYFARDYGLLQIVVGGTENKESSIPELKNRLDLAKASGAKVFFIQKDLDGRHAEAVAEKIDARMVEINPLDYSWMQQLTCIVDAIADGNN